MRVDKARFPVRKPEVWAIILTADKFEDMELFVPYFRLLEAGVGVDVAAPKVEKISGENGYIFENVDLTIDEVDPDKYDLLIIPGGLPSGAPSTVRKMPHAQEVAAAFFETGKQVAAICHGPYTLVSADVLRGRKLTSYWGDGVPEEIRGAGGEWIDAGVVVDGNLVSSRWPPDLPAFCREMMAAVERIRGSRR